MGRHLNSYIMTSSDLTPHELFKKSIVVSHDKAKWLDAARIDSLTRTQPDQMILPPTLALQFLVSQLNF